MVLTYFNDQWLGFEAHKEWLLYGNDRTSAKRKVCPVPRNKFELSKMSERAIKSHAKDNVALNTVIQMGQMDIVVNFWDNVVNKVCTRYLDSTFIGHVRHQDLFEDFISASDSLDLKKLPQVSMDGPNVNWAFFSELRKYRTESDMSKLLSTESCNLFSYWIYSWSFQN